MSDIFFRERGLANGVDRAIKLSTAGAVLAVAGIAAYISYWHAYAVVCEFGESGLTARMEPVTIDGLVYACSMVMLYSAWHRRPVPALARWLLALGIAATLAANMAQGLSHGAGGAVVAAWPAASLVGSYELLVWIIRTSAAIRLARVPDGEHADQPAGHAEPADRTNAGSRATARAEEITSGPPGWTGRTTAVPAGQDRWPVSGQVDDLTERAATTDVRESLDAEAVEVYLASVKVGKPLSKRKLAARFGKTSRRWAQNRMAEARAREQEQQLA